jgi:hypothetical protein
MLDRRMLYRELCLDIGLCLDEAAEAEAVEPDVRLYPCLVGVVM